MDATISSDGNVHINKYTSNRAAYEEHAEEIEAEKIKVTDILTVFKVNRPYLALCIHSVCICMVQGITQGASTYMMADVLGAIGLASVASLLSTVMMPPAPSLIFCTRAR